MNNGTIEKSFLFRVNKKIFMYLLIILFFTNLIAPCKALATAQNGIYANGLNGINININAAPYTTFATYSYGQYAYTSSGCAWFASARVNQLTGVNNVIYDGANWYNNQYSRYGFTKGQTVKAKALACYQGHVRVVEIVNGDTVTISEGGYNVASYASYGYTRIATMSIAALQSGGFLGYVYIGDFSNTPPSIALTALPSVLGPQITVVTNGTRIWYALFDNVGKAIALSFVDSQSNTWDFSKWSLAKGKYKFEAQASSNGLNSETKSYTFIIGVSITLTAVPSKLGPQISVNTDGTRIWYALYDNVGKAIALSFVDSQSNTWDFSKWSLTPGKYTFEAQASRDGGDSEVKSYTFTILQPVSSVKLNKSNLTIKKGKTYKLIAYISPSNASNKRVTWKTGNYRIAKVSSTGVVKAIKKGIVNIYVYTVDGKKTAKCKVTIK
ncbi:MAG: Ig-like domain-containing protein [Clostridia bacterium]|jgi:surface antigen